MLCSSASEPIYRLHPAICAPLSQLLLQCAYSFVRSVPQLVSNQHVMGVRPYRSDLLSKNGGIITTTAINFFNIYMGMWVLFKYKLEPILYHYQKDQNKLMLSYCQTTGCCCTCAGLWSSPDAPGETGCGCPSSLRSAAGLLTMAAPHNLIGWSSKHLEDIKRRQLSETSM